MRCLPAARNSTVAKSSSKQPWIHVGRTKRRCKQFQQQPNHHRRQRNSVRQHFHTCANRHSGRDAASNTAQVSSQSLRRQPSAIRSIMPLVNLPGMISLGGGLPNAAMFPVKAMSFQLQSGVGGESQTIQLQSDELNAALQYSPTPGLPGLVSLIKSVQQREHSPQYKDWGVSITNGSQDGLCKVFEMLLSREDHILVESPTYSGSLSFLQPYGCQITGIPTDEYGIIPSALRKVLAEGSEKPPKVLLTIPTGQNPGGSTATTTRKREIYQLVCEYDLTLMEDDPYYYLCYGHAKAPASPQEFTRPKVDSYLSMDTERRVIRFDSFSKVISSGVRIGFVTGPSELLQRMDLHSQATNLHASGLSQMIVQKVLEEWGEDGFNKHMDLCSYFYMQRRDAFHSAATRHLSELASWTVPTAGMFVWFNVHGLDDSKTLIETKAVDAKVLLVPGQAFSPNNEPSGHVRASFSTASEEHMDIALSRFADLLRNR